MCVCVHHYSSLKIRVAWLPLYSKFLSGGVSHPSDRLAFPLDLLSPNLGVWNSVLLWLGLRNHLFFPPPSGLPDPIISGHSCPRSVAFSFALSLPVTCPGQPGEAAGLSSDRQKKVTVVKALLLQLRQKLLRSTLELYPLFYISPPLLSLSLGNQLMLCEGHCNGEVQTGGSMEIGDRVDKKPMVWGHEEYSTLTEAGPRVGRRHRIFCPPGF